LAKESGTIESDSPFLKPRVIYALVALLYLLVDSLDVEIVPPFIGVVKLSNGKGRVKKDIFAVRLQKFGDIGVDLDVRTDL
jgi:hypothetical protein